MQIDISKLKNNKVHVAKYTDKGDFGGWFIGSFLKDDHLCKTKKVEVMYREHKRGHLQPLHYHKQKIEILLFLEGSAKYLINGKEYLLKKGDYMFADVNNVIEGEFLEDSKVIAIHSPSIVEDKVLMEG